jgi:hypothetical protein
MLVVFVIYFLQWHYEKSCPKQIDFPITKVAKKLIYNYVTIVLWKYGVLINTMSRQKIKELYYSYKLVAKWTSI